MPFRPLSPMLARRLVEAFPNYVAPQNPVDAWAVDDVERVFPGTLRLLAGSEEFDVLVAQVDQSQYLGEPEASNALLILNALADAVDGTSIFPAVASVQPCDPTPAVATAARERDVAMLRGARNAMRALAAVATWKPRYPPKTEVAPVDLSNLLRPGVLSEYESGAILERYAISVCPRRRAQTPDEAVEAAAELGFPVVVKRDGPAHKSRNGGVILGLGDAAAVRAAAERLGGRVLVAAQVPGGPEAYVGMTRDPDYGPVLAVGLGGSAVEQLPGSVLCIAPLDLIEARRLVEDAKVVSRAGSPAALDALARVLVAVGHLAFDHPEVAAVDINPLVLDDHGAMALDALVIVEGGG
jgi:acyl-CoA synthetase (NDP forming)